MPSLPHTQRNVASAGSRDEASFLLGKVSKQLDEGKHTDEFLEDIASLVPCKRWHRDQALGVFAKGQIQIDHAIAVQKPSGEHKSSRPALVSRPSSVAHGLSRRGIDAEWFLKVTRSLGAPGSFRSSRSQQSQLQSQAQRDTRLVIQSTTSSTSISTASESEQDPSSEMFGRTALARRILLPSAKFNIQTDTVSKEEPRFKCIIESKASPSCLAAVRYPKVMSTAPPTLEDMHRTLDEYMAKVRRMEPGPDVAGFKEDLEEKKLLLMQEVEDLVPPALRRRANRGTQADLPEVVEKKDPAVEEVIAKPDQKEPGEDPTDLTDQPEMDIKKVKSALITRIAQVVENLRSANDVKITAITTASNTAHEDKEVNIIAQQPERAPEPSKPVELEQTPESESPDKTEDMVHKDTKKDISIITNIYKLSTCSTMSSEDLISPSYSFPSSSPHSSLNPFPSPNSSVSSLVTLASPHPQFNDKEYKGVVSRNSNPSPSPSPYLSTSNPSPSQPPALQRRAGADNSMLPSPRPPDRSLHAYPALTHTLALVLATVEGFRWLVDTILLSYYLLFEGRDMRVFFWVGVYLWVLSCLGLL